MAKKTTSSGKSKGGSKVKKNPVLIIAVAAVVFIIVLALVLVYIFKPDVFNKLFGRGDGQEVAQGQLEDIKGADYSIHFLELGNKYTGDCTLIKCGDTEVLIDAGSRKDSAVTIKNYVDNYCTDGRLEYVISTHAHQDHIAGFVGSKSGSTMTGILYQYEVGTLIQFARTNATTALVSDYRKAVTYVEEHDGTVYTAKQCWEETDGASKSYALNADGTLTLNILYNYYYDNDTSDENNYSVCTLLSYKPEGSDAKHYLFTGDLEKEGESYLVEYNQNLPQVELFKAGHHGSKTSSTDKLLQIIRPKHVAVCCCAGSPEYTENNDNMFPTQAFVDRISAYTDLVFVTTLNVDYKSNNFKSMNGNIVFYVKADELKLWCSNNSTKLKDTDWFKQNRKCPSYWK